MRLITLYFVAGFSLVARMFADPYSDTGTGDAAEEIVRSAIPFAPTQVRLLSGPFKDALERRA